MLNRPAFLILLVVCLMISLGAKTKNMIPSFEHQVSPLDTVEVSTQKVKKKKRKGKITKERKHKKRFFQTLFGKFLLILLILAVLTFGGLLVSTTVFLGFKWLGWVIIGLIILFTLLSVRSVNKSIRNSSPGIGFRSHLKHAIGNIFKSCFVLFILIAGGIAVLVVLFVTLFGWKGLVVLGLLIALIRLIAQIFN